SRTAPHDAIAPGARHRFSGPHVKPSGQWASESHETSQSRNDGPYEQLVASTAKIDTRNTLRAYRGLRVHRRENLRRDKQPSHIRARVTAAAVTTPTQHQPSKVCRATLSVPLTRTSRPSIVLAQVADRVAGKRHRNALPMATPSSSSEELTHGASNSQ